MLILLILLLASFGYYLWFLLTVWRGLKRREPPRAGSAGVFVSVVVAARNEEENIRRCLESLLDQDFPKDAYEVIVVDDHSTDRTPEIANEIAGSEPRGRLAVMSLGDGAGSSGKPSAIGLGVRQARGDLILCTDADCIVPRGWMSSMARQFAPGVAFVAGPVLEAPSRFFLSRLQSLEFMGLITTTAGLIGARRPIICNGANIAYRKSAFQAVNGYGEGSGSCDDETLMQRIATRAVGGISFNKDSEAIVLTSTPRSIHEFWSQRTRWAAKRGRYENKAILLRLILLYAFFPILLAAAIASAFEPWLWVVVAASLVLKACADYITLREGARMLHQAVPPWHFLIAELLHVPYIASAGLIGQLGSICWKDRNLNR
jgi:cellulose synthase/poly-beta-1,6-N-acetylglucosamine synthase-like glycosyltransferase